MSAKTSLYALITYFALSFALPLQAQSPQIETFYFTVDRQGQSFDDVLENEIGIPSALLFEQGWAQKLKQWNPQLTQGQSVSRGEKIYIELPYGTVLSPKMPRQEVIPVVAPMSVAEQRQKPLKSSTTPLADRWKLKALYSFSMGDFSQTSNDGNDFVNSDQNTPIQMGLESSYLMSESNYLSGHLSVSKLYRAEVKDTNENLDLPWEYNLEVLYRRAISEGRFLPYGGLSYEKISSYNVSQFKANAEPIVLENTQLYLSVGSLVQFELWAKKFVLDLQYAHILSSSTSEQLSTDEADFSGHRTQLKLDMLTRSKWSYFVGYSNHSFNGPTDLSINRYAIGFSYTFL